MAYRLIPPGIIAINIGVNETDFLAELRIPGTEVQKAFYRGHLRQMVEVRGPSSNPLPTAVIQHNRN